MVHAAGCWLPATWGRYPPAQGAHGSPGATVLLEHPWLQEKLSLWPPPAGASRSLGRREQAWGTLLSCPASRRGTAVPQ